MVIRFSIVFSSILVFGAFLFLFGNKKIQNLNICDENVMDIQINNFMNLFTSCARTWACNFIFVN